MRVRFCAAILGALLVPGPALSSPDRDGLRPKLARSADSPGARTVTYSGEPTVASSVSGSGKVIKK